MAFTKIAAAGIGSTETVTLHSLEVINNATVGGVLTYEDVTNVDSIGLITARNGIVVGSGITLSKDGDGFYTGVVTATSFSGSGQFLTGIDTDLVSDTSPQLGGNLASNGKLIKFGDSSGATDDRLTFGNGDDIQIYYSTSNLYITQATGDIILENNANDKDVDIKTDDGSGDTALYFKADGSTGESILYNYGNEKIKTTSSGVTVTGTVAATSYTGDGSSLTGIAATANVRTGILDVAGIATFRSDVNVPNINGGQIGGRRNLVINGAMQVAQRGTSSSSDGYQTVDRFKFGYGGEDEAPVQYQGSVASHESPYAEGFRYNYYVQNGNQSSGAGSADYAEFQYKVEAQDIAQSGWNYTSSSSFITLSFWLKSNVGQNFYGFVYSADGTAQRYIFETGTVSANSWNKIVVKIPGNSNVAFDTNNGEGLVIKWIPFYGTDKTNNSATVGSWANYNGAARCPDNTSTWWTTDNSTFYLTGVQLEVGSTATPFEHLSYGETLQLCKRYFQIHAGVNSDHMMWGTGRAEANTGRIGLPVAVAMRDTPTVYAAKNRLMRYDGTASDSTSTPSVLGNTIVGGNIYTIDFGGHSSLSHNNMYQLTSSADSRITFDSEL